MFLVQNRRIISISGLFRIRRSGTYHYPIILGDQCGVKRKRIFVFVFVFDRTALSVEFWYHLKTQRSKMLEGSRRFTPKQAKRELYALPDQCAFHGVILYQFLRHKAYFVHYFIQVAINQTTIFDVLLDSNPCRFTLKRWMLSFEFLLTPRLVKQKLKKLAQRFLKSKSKSHELRGIVVLTLYYNLMK